MPSGRLKVKRQEQNAPPCLLKQPALSSLPAGFQENSRVRYVSTRGEAPTLGFADVLLAGLARDGGLYVPESWPQLSAETIAGFAGKSFAEVAVEVILPFVSADISRDELSSMARRAYGRFGHVATTPLVQVAPNDFILELFHGPTLAFKDVAMQLLAELMDHVLKKRGQRATIVGATSGDTGGAAIEAFRGSSQVDVVILFPDGRVSDVQRRMMTTPTETNVHSLSIAGDFDDCQALVKAMFVHHEFRDRVGLSGVNSINWARIVAQVVYYFVAAVALGAPARKVAFTVPTGNFGDILAGWVAKKMGLPIDRLVIATNVNDILARTLETGRYEVTGTIATTSPSMDIQVSSNFERLIFEAVGRDAGVVRGLMANLAQSRAFTLPEPALAAIRADFIAERASEAEVSAMMAGMLARTGYLLDPHTAVASVAAAKVARDPATPMVILSTAHPAKFPDAVKAATGVTPGLPARLSTLMSDAERMTHLPADQGAVETFVEANARAVKA